MSDAAKRRPTAEDIPAILDAVADGDSLRKACRLLGIHPGHAHAMIDGDESPDGWRAQYARAREQRADVLAEQALNLGVAAAMGAKVEGRTIKPDGARVAIDAIKWATARMAPKTAPVQRVSHSFEDLSDEELNQRIRSLQGGDEPAPDA